MDIKEIKKLVALMQETGLLELEIEESGKRIRIQREAIPSARAVSSAPLVLPVSAETPIEVERKVDGHAVCSPIVGVFYRAPSPDTAPYVETGSVVRKGQSLCIVEAMKLMNEIESDVDGKVAEIYVEDGARVEYGTPLFRIEPA